MRSHRLVLTLLALSLSGLRPVRAASPAVIDYWPDDSWPQWRRDPAKNAFNPASTLPGVLPEPLWRFSTGGNGVNSSPAVINGKVFFGTNSGMFYCLKQITDHPDGDVLWAYRTGGRIWSAPAVAYNRVFIASLDGFLYCFRETPSLPPAGEVIWRYYIGPIEAMTSSPCVVNGRVYVGSETGYLYCFDALTDDSGGNLLWRYHCGGWIHGSPSVSSGRVYIGTAGPTLPTNGYRLFCLEAQTEDPEGKLIWSIRFGDRRYGSFPTPAVANGKVYTSADDGWLRCLDAATGAKVWERFIHVMDAPSAALAYGRLYKSYEFRGGIDCWEAEPANDVEGDGELIWSHLVPDVDRSGATVADGKVLHTNIEGRLYCYAAHADQLNVLWIFRSIVPVEPIASAPSIANGMIFIGDGNGVWALREPGGNLPPVVNARVSSVSDLTVTFTASGTDIDGSVTTYVWRFGDGSDSFLQSPVHSYASAGTFIASVTAIDNRGAKNEATVFISITDGNGTRFARGDANADGRLDVADGIAILRYLFEGFAPPPCLKGADTNDDSALDIGDVVFLLSYLFFGGPVPPDSEPLGTCGRDPTPDDLSCDSFPPCNL